MENPGNPMEIPGEPFSNPLKWYYEGLIEEDLDHIRFVGEENKTLQEIRENHQGDEMIVHLCREILFNNVKTIDHLRRRIENARTELKRLG